MIFCTFDSILFFDSRYSYSIFINHNSIKIKYLITHDNFYLFFIVETELRERKKYINNFSWGLLVGNAILLVKF